MADLIGHSLGRYHLTEQLGEGGMATVYKAYDTRLESDVAVKVIRTENLTLGTMERSLKRFEREAKALARLTHPFILKVIDYGEYENKPYLVMEYLPGGTLKQRLGKPMEWQEALRILLPIAQALDYAHRQNMIHRDVKPSNILFTADGAPMLTDFGIAKILDLEETADLTGTGMGIGTPEYMAPEQWTGKTSTLSDQYALGVVLYEMLTGRKPYTADTPAAILLKQATEPLPRPSQYARELPDKVEKILLKALAKNPVDRYASMGDFASALESLLTGTVAPVKEQPVRQRERTADIKASVEAKEEPTIRDLPAKKLPARELSEPREKPRIPWMVLGGVVLGLVVLSGILGWALGGGTTLFPTRTPSATFTPIATFTPTVTPTPILGVGSMWTSPQDGMVMMYIPAGEFSMGSEDGSDDEKPIHTVSLVPYWIDQTEVTNQMYAEFLNSEGNQSEGGVDWLDSNDEDVLIHLAGNTWVVESGYENHPVIEMSWFGAQSYCEWRGARLPTEAEWEKAASWNSTTNQKSIYPWGNDFNCKNGNFDDETQEDSYVVPGGANCDGFPRTAPVGSFQAGRSFYGLLDMAGNVWEWVTDRYDAYPGNTTSNSSYGTQYRVLRGGSWVNDLNYVRSSVRGGDAPDVTYYLIGFRCARSQ